LPEDCRCQFEQGTNCRCQFEQGTNCAAGALSSCHNWPAARAAGASALHFHGQDQIGGGRCRWNLFEKSGLAIAIETAPEEVRLAAHVVTASPEMDGFARAVARFVLGSANTSDIERSGA